MTIRDETQPDGKWDFNEDVTDAFDNMLERSIPQYDVMRNAVTELAVRRHQPDGHILDLGTSRGNTLHDLIRRLGVNATYTGLDVSEPMLTAARTSLARWIDLGYANIIHHDLRRGLPPGTYQTILSILTLQFVPIEYRQNILTAARHQLAPNGTFIIVEKVLGRPADLDTLMVDIYLDQKHANGYTREQIERKRLSLEGVLVPTTANTLETMLHDAGFTNVDCFWRWMNFTGYIATP